MKEVLEEVIKELEQAYTRAMELGERIGNAISMLELVLGQKKGWPKWIQDIIVDGKRPFYVGLRICGNIHRVLMRASNGEWNSVSYLREQKGSAREVQIACMLGLLESDKKPWEKGKKYRITDLGIRALKELNFGLERNCAWYHNMYWLGKGDRFTMCRRRQCRRPYIWVGVRINEDWVKHMRRYRW